MIREEAINHLKTVAKTAIDSGYDSAVVDAVDMAIKALEQEPCGKDINVPATDAISRQAVLDGVDRYIYKSQSTGAQDDFYSFAELVVKQLPSVTSQPKTGHWIENAPEYQNIDPPYICSECGNMHLRKTNYCDQCGAKMVEPQESEGKE